MKMKITRETDPKSLVHSGFWVIMVSVALIFQLNTTPEFCRQIWPVGVALVGLMFGIRVMLTGIVGRRMRLPAPPPKGGPQRPPSTSPPEAPVPSPISGAPLRAMAAEAEIPKEESNRVPGD